ncbi:MAG: hypothetical protein PHX20_01305, partial [Candidatus Omnitrophica bacterium]|nr:hypothetical protein [Candidatus Omnitrophota bacterium]
KRRTVILVPNISRAASAGIGARQKAYLLRDPQAFESIQIAKLQHKQIVEALMKGDFVALGRLEWEYTENRAKIHADAVPDEMRSLFNWLLGKEALVVGGNTVAPQPEKPLILGGELAGSMGTGASASLLASDFGLEAAADGRSTRLESALSLAIEKAPYFSNAYRRYFRLSDKGPEIEIVQRLSTKDETKKPDNNKPAVPDTELEAIIADVAATTGTMSLHLASRYAEAKVLNGFVVVMKENLPESVTGAKGGLIDPILRHEYQRMQQEIGKLFAGSARGLLKANKDNFAKTVSEALGRGLKVIVLDDGELTGEAKLGNIPGAVPGVNCCAINAEKDTDPTAVPFVNLNAMAMMGVGILTEDGPLFKLAYRTFRGKDYAAGILDFADKSFWAVVSVLPRHVPLTNALGVNERARKLFAAAA